MRRQPLPRPELVELARRVSRGELRLIYVLGVPRANTTVLCRLLGRRVHGAVYEPALPNSAFPSTAYGVKILAAADLVRRQLPAGETAVLAVKDMSALMRPAERDFVLDHSAHVVFAIREPVAQHDSYARQMLMEFSAGNRLRAFLAAPWETTMYGLHFGKRLVAYRRLARERLGVDWQVFRRATSAGANIEFWQELSAHFAMALTRLPVHRISVIDAGLSRLEPEAAEAELDAIAGPHMPGTRVERPVDYAGHTMMKSASPWAGEAMRAERMLAASPAPRAASPYKDFDSFLPKIAGSLYPIYLDLFFHPTHRLRSRFGSAPANGLSSDEGQVLHRLVSSQRAEALSLARESGRIAA